MNDEQFDFSLEDQDEYAKIVVRMVDGSTIKGTVQSTKRLSDEVNDPDGFLVVHDAVCRFGDGKGLRRNMIFLNKAHIAWAVPAS